MRNVIFFSSLLLPPSQTFIRAQGEKLQNFTPYYVGSRRVPGLELPIDRTLVLNPGNQLGKLAEANFKLTGFAPKFYRQIERLNPVLLHAQFGLSGVLVLPWIRQLKIPLLVHYRGADATITPETSRYVSLNHWIYFQRREALKQETTLFLTVSKFIKQKLVEQGFPEAKIRPHYHGVDTTQFQADLQVPRESIVLFVGRLTEKKGLEDLIRAMAKIQAEGSDAKLIVIGDGVLRENLENQARNTLKNYEFLGVRPQSEVKIWMNRAKVLATPSVTASDGDTEGLPNVVLEAQAMNLPVVATVHAGIPEAVLHEETGFLVPERDSEGLAIYLSKVLQNEALWQRLSDRGREWVCEQFDRDRQTRVLEDIYETVLGQTNS
ncbi:MAG: glycosyltransferase [Cyanobacteria bacterium SID2]|nr:glycosyltransferase [Cyanobacteria bacterium SID2]MBP0005167.1 glycosyltransferase [Cyanobacteria bacterium SBC]